MNRKTNFTLGRAPQQVTQQSSGPATVLATTVTSAPKTATVDAVRAAIQAQVRAGQVNADGIDDIAKALNDVERDLARGRTNEAAQNMSDLRARSASFATTASSPKQHSTRSSKLSTSSLGLCQPSGNAHGG
jgi:hypothetical protein